MSNGSSKAPSKTTFHLLAGLSSGVLSAVLLQPIDLLKTRVQQSGHNSLRRVLADLRTAAREATSAASVRGSTSPGAAAAAAPRPRSFVASLYRGTVPSALRTGFGSALYFAGLNAIRSSAAKVPILAASSTSGAASGSGRGSSGLVKLSNTGNMLAGAVARASAGFVLMPLTIIKVRYESSLYNYRSLAEAATDIVRKEGLRGFFSGFGATAIRDAPYAGLYVLMYEQIKRRLNTLAERRQSTAGGHHRAETSMGVSRAAAINFSSGVLAAATCSAVSNPFDAVKTRIQLQPARYRNMLHAARRMLAEEGVRSMWNGLALRMSRKAMSSALAWTVYEELIRRAETRWAAAAAANGASETEAL
ncbi:solute carrier family 25, member 38 [Sporothrix brasiliensis 5110]|uniref:Mitochondrial glycine transporter n=1 Tax=Sporothrix brasiliensis 5110 TaxID=1398154 RepID=A0A0C2J2R2_9PEZI|nr:solute carrier family 25, member 38 [Sporothrix brasiliensis 5110]KIH91377.1 solute carrier family 25, member 38 [Sporothrix brasiliensis 5110]